MFREHAAASVTTLLQAPTNIADHRTPAHSVDVKAISGARRGFEGLILNRGRQCKREAGGSPETQDRKGFEPPFARPTALHVGIAESLEQVEAANRLICKRYAWRGYSLEGFDDQSHISANAKSPHEITFFAAVPPATHGTVTLRLDGPEGLRAEATHHETVHHARANGRRIGELTRLAVAEDASSRVVLASLFGVVYAVGRMVHGVTDAFIEVNPRHVAFYSRALGFTIASDARFCERVRAPSVLLHLDVEMLDEQLGFPARDAAEEPLMRYGT